MELYPRHHFHYIWKNQDHEIYATAYLLRFYVELPRKGLF